MRPPRRVVLSVNAAWNIANFRAGLIAGLHRAGYAVAAMAPPDAASGRVAELGATFVPIAIDRQGLSPVADMLLLGRYWRLLRSLRPAVYLSFTPKPNIYGTLAASALGIPAICTVSGLGTAFIGRGLLARLLSWLYRAAFSRAAMVFFQNEEDRALFVAGRIVPPDRTGLLAGSGVDLARFQVVPLPERTGGALRFLFAGRLLRDKGVGEFVEAARRVRAHYPEAQFQLLGFVGAANRTAISEREVQAWEAEGVIEYLGATDDVRPFLAAADCVVLPSYREGLPRSLLEAAAIGRPLIATDVPGCRQVVRHGVTGLLCRPRDAASLGAAMLGMIEAGADTRRAWADNARRMVEAEYDEAAVVAAYLEAVGAVLSG